MSVQAASQDLAQSQVRLGWAVPTHSARRVATACRRERPPGRRLRLCGSVLRMESHDKVDVKARLMGRWTACRLVMQGKAPHHSDIKRKNSEASAPQWRRCPSGAPIRGARAPQRARCS
jgi:hypothetical protein